MIKQKFDDMLIDNLRQIIKDQHSALLATINAEVVVLFWSIGNELNELAQDTTKGLGIENNLLEDLSRDFMPIFGGYFSIHNLKLMRRFADKCSLDTISKIAAAINWEYIPYLLNIEGEKAYIYYMQLIHVKSLNPSDLNKEILAGTFEKGIVYNENAFLQSYSKPFYQNTIELYFGKEHAEKFRKLFEPKEREDITIKNSINKTTYQTIFQLILDCQSNAQYMLNLQFNTLLWDIGNEILSHSSPSSTPVANSLMEHCIQELHKDFPSIFNNSELPYCIKFAQSYKNPDKQQEMAETISWDYVKILLEINDVKKQAFIANEILANGITIQDVKGLILNGCFDFMTESNPLIKFPITKTSVTKETRENNVIVHLTEETIEPKINPKSDVNRNMFQNETLLQFIKANSHLQ
ncbi:MAG TPA: DUF1016 N-terminal domain-containing protein [Pedobacter sp.]|nr:DUF1016 N-terminal domain-containing protein [Pedobacter sp.]